MFIIGSMRKIIMEIKMNLRSKKNKYKRRREDILSLRRQGLSYEQIRKELGCSKKIFKRNCFRS